MSCAHTVQLHSHWPHVAMEPFGNKASAVKFWFDLMLINLNLDSHVWLQALNVDRAVPELCGPHLLRGKQPPPGAGPSSSPGAAVLWLSLTPSAPGPFQAWTAPLAARRWEPQCSA